MVNIPVTFKRVAAAFDEVASRVRSCDESSGSEHSADLSDLVNSFFEREIREQREINEKADERGIDVNEINEDDDESGSNGDLALQDSLKKLFDYGKDDVKLNIRVEVEKALMEVCENSSPDFNRRLMARLRDRGFDAGLCKSKWGKNGRRPSGDYEYIDVNVGETRYIIEVSLAAQFVIARPTLSYASLLEVIPPIYVGKPEDLKKVVRLMCNAIRKSVKSVDMHITPWRRMAYMQAKWFESYKRTTNESSTRNELIFGVGVAGSMRSVGFAPVKGISFNCREDYVSKGGVRVGNLAMALKQEETVS